MDGLCRICRRRIANCRLKDGFGDVATLNRADVRSTAESSSAMPIGGFTLVELLIVIVIIGILVALITTAAVTAVKHARQTEIKSEVNEINDAFELFHKTYGEYPPNCQSD